MNRITLPTSLSPEEKLNIISSDSRYQRAHVARFLLHRNEEVAEQGGIATPKYVMEYVTDMKARSECI